MIANARVIVGFAACQFLEVFFSFKLQLSGSRFERLTTGTIIQTQMTGS